MITSHKRAIEFLAIFGNYALEMGEGWRTANPDIMDAYEYAIPFPREERGSQLVQTGWKSDGRMAGNGESK